MKLIEPPKTLMQSSGKIWTEIFDGRLEWNRAKTSADAVSQVTKAEVIELFELAVGRASARQLAIHVHGKNVPLVVDDSGRGNDSGGGEEVKDERTATMPTGPTGIIEFRKVLDVIYTTAS